MCLILFAQHRHPEYRLVLAANRDEFYRRPAAPVHYWHDSPSILAGRDLTGGGTWLGITHQGRWAAITNFRDPASTRADAPSRGNLVVDFLAGDSHPLDYLREMRDRAHTYNGFNLLTGDAGEICYYSNRCDEAKPLDPGVYGLSNHLLDTAWPKIVKGKEMLRELLDAGSRIEPRAFLPLLSDISRPEDIWLPDTGVGIEWERILSPIFIASQGYGTRCSTVLTITYSGEVELTEFTWYVEEAVKQAQRRSTIKSSVSYRFTIET